MFLSAQLIQKKIIIFESDIHLVGFILKQLFLELEVNSGKLYRAATLLNIF